MAKLVIFAVISCVATVAVADYNGPFLLWGPDNLKDIDISTLSSLDELTLRNLYSESSAIVLFVRNSTTRLSLDNYPTFASVVSQGPSKYLTQYWLPADPVDYNVNTEVINLVGPISQQDVEIAALFKDATLTYGDGKVLGILAHQPQHQHEVRKREAADEKAISTTTEIPDANEEKPEENFVYKDSGKALLYTTAAPVLTDGDFGNNTELNIHVSVTGDTRENYFLQVVFKLPNSSKVKIRFKFIITNQYWTLIAAEVGELAQKNTLTVVGNEPSAPIGQSYACSRPLVFRNGSAVLTLKTIQVQAAMNGKERFGNAYDCVGFTSAPIWSGVLVSLFISFIVAIGITSIMDIKPPNRFESSRGKQLTFTIQE